MDEVFATEPERRRQDAANPATRCCFGLVNILRMVATSGRCNIESLNGHFDRMVRIHGLEGEELERITWFKDNLIKAYMAKMGLCHTEGASGAGCGECYGCRAAYEQLGQ
jgi:hypothetical protein